VFWSASGGGLNPAASRAKRRPHRPVTGDGPQIHSGSTVRAPPASPVFGVPAGSISSTSHPSSATGMCSTPFGTADGESVRASAGTFVNLPKESRHLIRNVGDRPGRMLVLCAPAGIEGFFAAADGQGPDKVVELAPRYGIHILPPGSS
jgi:hypothetical protein